KNPPVGENLANAFRRCKLFHVEQLIRVANGGNRCQAGRSVPRGTLLHLGHTRVLRGTPRNHGTLVDASSLNGSALVSDRFFVSETPRVCPTWNNRRP